MKPELKNEDNNTRGVTLVAEALFGIVVGAVMLLIAAGALSLAGHPFRISWAVAGVAWTLGAATTYVWQERAGKHEYK